MNRLTSPRRGTPALFAALILLFSSCAAPAFVPDGPFERTFSEFRRLEVKPVRVTLESTNPTQEQEQWAQHLAAEFGDALLHRFHRRGRLDAAEGPALVLECRVLRCEWTEVAGSEHSTARCDARIQIVVTFWNKSGTRIGSGSVTAAGTGITPHVALENARNGAIASLYKFVRKGAGPKPELRAEEPEEPPVLP